MKQPIFSRAFILAMAFSMTAVSQSRQDSLVSTGKASFYADQFHGQETSSGEVYNQNDFTAAHKSLPFGTIVSVTNKKNGRNVIVRINDRGPFVRSRIIDLTKSAAKKIRMIPMGVVPVRIQVLDVLDHCPLHDTLFKAGEIWDCYGNKREFSRHTVYIWATEDIKHAFYMATSIALDYRMDSIFVAVSESRQGRRYKLYASDLASGKDAGSVVETFQKDGFRFSKLHAENDSSKDQPPRGQSAK